MSIERHGLIADDQGTIEFETKAPSEVCKQLGQYLNLGKAK
jgi:hypothetical protein